MAFHALLACYNMEMNRDGLPQYIKIQLDQRVPLEKIIATLKVGGWSEIDIQAALSMMPKNDAQDIYKNDIKIENKKRSFTESLLAVFLCLIILFFSFSILFNEGIIDFEAIKDIPQTIYEEENINNISTTTQTVVKPIYAPQPKPVSKPASKPISRPTQIKTVQDISLDDKDQIISAILTLESVLQSNNATSIKSFLKVSATGEELNKINTMTDTEILSYASNLSSSLNIFTLNNMNSSKAIFKRIDANTVEVTVVTDITSSKRVVRLVDDVWY